jgi:FtsP/CotA-like multicopper oxidase with cupredoxin domain
MLSLKTRTVLLILLVALAPACVAATRHYYIAAEDVTWDYAPGGQDVLHGRQIPMPWAAQTKWSKTRYIEYTDATFSVGKPQPEWLGILGPVIRGEVGDTIIVDFLNRSRIPHSIHPHGLRYDKANEGALYLPAGAGARVPPGGGRFTYQWFADEGSGPGKDGSSSVVWWYHGHTDEASETNAGLLGPIIITAKGQARPDGTPKDVDREFVALFMIFDELRGKDTGLFYSINGYIFGNLPGLVMKQGDRVRWYLLGMGGEKDLHTPHWHGKTVQYGNRHADVIELLPGSMVAVDMVADNPGTWLFHCHVSEHMEDGMMATYTIYQPPPRSCPIQFVSADFWKTPGKFTLTVRNVGPKTIQKLAVGFDHLMSPQSRRRPYVHEWAWTQPIEPGRERTFEMPGYLADFSGRILGWALSSIKTAQTGAREKMGNVLKFIGGTKIIRN